MSASSRSFRVPAGAFGRRPGTSLATAVVAWSCMVLAARSPLAAYLSHDVLGRADVPVPAALAGYAAGWLLMVTAMMLPVALMLAAPVRGRGGWLAGYLGAWLAAGSVFAWLDLLLHALVGPSTAWPVTIVRTGVVTGGAGLSLVLAWREGGRHESAGAHAAAGHTLGQGWLHGLRCVWTCGPMMLALQAGTPGDLSWMALAAAGLALVRLRGLI